jgi:tRNA pseudouridine38-40 synthase
VRILITLQVERTIKLKLVIAYDGRKYAGWQVQKTGVAVQQIMEEIVARYFPSKPSLISSSRTDAGVHALGMVAHMEIPKTEFTIPPRKLVLALNRYLPEDVRVVSVRRVRSHFHARFDALGKQYRYVVWNHSAMNPLLRHTAWQVPQVLDLAAMRAAAKLFIGKHDFRSFAAMHSWVPETTVRTVTRCDIRRNGPLITFVIEADGFLYKMCRGIVGTLVQLGRGKFAVSDIKAMLAAKKRAAAGMNAPAHGLVLWKVYYPRKSRASKAHERRPG